MISLNAIIVDDEPNARMSIRGLLEENYPHVHIVAECASVSEAVKAIHRSKPNVVFLDIEMPGQNGFALLDYFDETSIDFKLIFVTAYNDYALQAFELAAVDYLLKPVRNDHLQRALKRVEGYFSLHENYSVLKENLQHNCAKKIILPTLENIYVVRLEDIIFIHAEGNYTKFHTTSQGLLTISKKIAEFDYLESTDLFFRSHRSFIINLDKVRMVDKKNHVVIMSNDEQAYLAQDKKHLLLEKIEQR